MNESTKLNLKFSHNWSTYIYPLFNPNNYLIGLTKISGVFWTLLSYICSLIEIVSHGVDVPLKYLEVNYVFCYVSGFFHIGLLNMHSIPYCLFLCSTKTSKTLSDLEYLKYSLLLGTVVSVNLLHTLRCLIKKSG